MAYPLAEIDISISMVSNLIRSQAPQFRDLQISYLDAGWDNVNFRLGNDYIIRLPRRAKAVPLLDHEISFLPIIEKNVSISIPAPIFVGHAEGDYPWRWTVVPYYRGVAVDDHGLAHTEAKTLAMFLKNLHRVSIHNLPRNEHRDVPLKDKEEAFTGYLDRLKSKGIIIPSKIHDLWRKAVSAPSNESLHLIHGDLHPRNIIMDNDTIAAIIDWGDITSGDPATDLGSLWLLFPSSVAYKAASDHYLADEDMIDRSIGWAIYFMVVLMDTGTDSDNIFSRIGKLALKRIQGE